MFGSMVQQHDLSAPPIQQVTSTPRRRRREARRAMANSGSPKKREEEEEDDEIFCLDSFFVNRRYARLSLPVGLSCALALRRTEDRFRLGLPLLGSSMWGSYEMTNFTFGSHELRLLCLRAASS